MSVQNIIKVLMGCQTSNPGFQARRKGYHMFLPSERYRIDFAEDFKSGGWEQYDTGQDAWYFGVWVNPGRRMILSYTEGDWALFVFEDYVAYNQQIMDMNRYYDEGFILKAFDENGMTVFCQDRSEFFVKELAAAT